jgi:hypothetical protein
MQHHDNIRRRPVKSKKPATNTHQKPKTTTNKHELILQIIFGSPAFQRLCLDVAPKMLKGSGGGPMSCWVPNCLVCSPSLVGGEVATLGDEADQGSATVQGSSFKAALAVSAAMVVGGCAQLSPADERTCCQLSPSEEAAGAEPKLCQDCAQPASGLASQKALPLEVLHQFPPSLFAGPSARHCVFC